MKYQKGDLVLCPPQGPHRGHRLGKVTIVMTNAKGKDLPIVGVKYIDYPRIRNGKITFEEAAVRPIRKIIIPD